MATTTNYGWDTPDDTDLVKDGAAAIRTLGSSVDTTTKALNPSTTLGDIEFRSATANTNTRLGIGTSGQVLAVSGGVPAWVTAGGGGKVLQVVGGTTSTTVSSSSNTYVDTGLTASITPSSASSRILVLVSQNALFKDEGDYRNAINLQILRGATQIVETGGIAYLRLAVNQAIAMGTSWTYSYLDSPATTSATTYKTQFRNQFNGGTVYCQDGSEISSIILLEIGA